MKIKVINTPSVKYELKIRETLDGRIFIFDHPDIDIVYSPKDSKIVTFPKEEMNEYVYGSQSIFFDYMVKKGLVLPETIQGGSVYFSIEGQIPKSEKDIKSSDLALVNIAEFLESEKDYFDKEKEYKERLEKRLYSPSEEESTDLGEVPQKEKQGAISPNTKPYNFGGSFGVTYE